MSIKAKRKKALPGVPRSTAMKLTGHLTDSVYSRYAIVDSSMLEEGVAKLAALHANGQSRVQVSPASVKPLGKSL